MKMTKPLIVPAIWLGFITLCFIGTFAMTVSGDKFLNALVLTFFVAIGSAGYLLPSFIAGVRNAPRYEIILAVNILGGWSGVGWIAALIWAITDSRDEERQVVVQQIIYQTPPPALPPKSPPTVPNNIG